MRETGLSLGRFAVLVDLHRNTVSNWMNGKIEPSGAALAYLRLYRSVQAALPPL